MKSTGQSTDFSVNITDSIYKIFSELIYSRPVEAVVRELATNAADAQIEAKSKRPVEVSIDNRTFSIRDYGTGLPPENFTEIYSTYLLSTKADDKRTTGKFGLGSKSPFAVTDMWTVNNFYNGYVYTYVMHMEDGRPRAEYMGNVVDGKIVGRPSTEPNGLHVSFKIKDTSAFYESIRTVYYAFPEHLLPKTSVSLLRPSYVFSDNEGRYHVNNWTLPGQFKYLRYKQYVIMGNIRYEVDKDLISGNRHEIDSLFNYCSMDVIVEVDGLDIPTSREELYYSEKTINRLRKIYLQIHKEILEEQKKRFDGLSPYKVLKKQVLEKDFINNFTAKTTNIYSLLKTADKISIYTKGDKNYNLDKKNQSSHDVPIIFEKDVKTRFVSIIQKYMEEHYPGRIAALLSFENEVSKREFLDKHNFDNDDIISIASLEKDYYVPKEKDNFEIRYSRIYHYHDNSYKLEKKVYKHSELLNGGVYYAVDSEYSIGSYYTRSRIREWQDTIGETIYVVLYRPYKFMEKNDKWISIDEKLKSIQVDEKEIQEYIFTKNYDRRLIEFYSNIFTEDNIVKEKYKNFDKEFPANFPVLVNSNDLYKKYNTDRPFAHIGKPESDLINAAYQSGLFNSSTIKILQKGVK